MSKMALMCHQCSAIFQKERGEYNRRIRKGAERFFCGFTCSVRYGNSLRLPGTSKTTQGRRAKTSWIDFYGSAPNCDICGRSSADIHHIDGNKDNNVKSNLRGLCRSHHIALENANRVTGRGSKQV